MDALRHNYWAFSWTSLVDKHKCWLFWEKKTYD